MVLAGLLVGATFHALGSVPSNRNVAVFATTISWDANTFVNIAFLLLMVVLLVRFLRSGAVAMLREMEVPPPEQSQTKDPVCGMAVDPDMATERADYGSTTYSFCSPGCRAAFTKDPRRFLESTTSVQPSTIAR